MRRLAFLFALAGLAPALPASAQKTEAHGYLTCETGEPIAWVRARTARTYSGPGIIAHELHHEEMARAMGGCKVFMKWVQNPANRLGLEALAYCVQSMVEFGMGLHASPEAAFIAYGSRLAHPMYRWPTTIPDSTATRLIRSSCEVTGRYPVPDPG